MICCLSIDRHFAFTKMSDFSEQEKKEMQRAYMRDYMRRRYHNSPTEERIYRNTIRIQKQPNIDDVDPSRCAA